MTFQSLVRVAAATLVVACSNSAITLNNQVVPVACGRCIYHMQGVPGCQWAAEVQGKHYLVQSGKLPKDHAMHAPDGMCNMARQATITGTVRGDRLVATQFELLPVDASAVPAKPQYPVEDVH